MRDMARNAAGRRQDTSNQFFSQNWNAPFVGSGRMPAACSRRSSASRTTTCSATTSTEPPHGCCNTLQRAARDRRQLGDRDRLPWLAQLPPRAHVRSQRCASGNVRQFRTNDPTRSSPGFRRSATSPKRVQLAERQADAAPQQRVLALIGYTLSKSEDNGSGIRTLNGDQLFPPEQQLRGG